MLISLDHALYSINYANAHNNYIGSFSSSIRSKSKSHGIVTPRACARGKVIGCVVVVVGVVVVVVVSTKIAISRDVGI